jgi:hypothetical protein
MNSGTQSPDQLFGYDVVDSSGKKIGSVDGVWVDDATETRPVEGEGRREDVEVDRDVETGDDTTPTP